MGAQLAAQLPKSGQIPLAKFWGQVRDARATILVLTEFVGSTRSGKRARNWSRQHSCECASCICDKSEITSVRLFAIPLQSNNNNSAQPPPLPERHRSHE